MMRLAAIFLMVAAMASAQTLQQDMHKIGEEFDALPKLYRYPPHAQLTIALIRMNSRQAQEAEVQARYAPKGKERRRFKAAQKRAERALRENRRALELDCPPHTDACY